MAPEAAFRRPPGNSLRNQNLLYLVFKCTIKTNHSSSIGHTQALFDAQNKGSKSEEKSAFYRQFLRLCTIDPPEIHGFVHRCKSYAERKCRANVVRLGLMLVARAGRHDTRCEVECACIAPVRARATAAEPRRPPTRLTIAMAATDPNKPAHPGPHLGDETMPGHMDGLVDTTGRGSRHSRYALEPGADAPTMLGGFLGRHLAAIGTA